MRSEEEIKRLRSEISDWLSLIQNMHQNMWDIRVIAFLVASHDSLNWALGSLPRFEGAINGIDFDATISHMRETMENVKAKQHKHRNPGAN